MYKASLTACVRVGNALSSCRLAHDTYDVNSVYVVFGVLGIEIQVRAERVNKS